MSFPATLSGGNWRLGLPALPVTASRGAALAAPSH